MRMCTNDRYITKLLVNTKTSSRHMAMMLVIDYLQWLFRIECWNVKGKQNKTQRNSPTSEYNLYLYIISSLLAKKERDVLYIKQEQDIYVCVCVCMKQDERGVGR